MSEATEKDPIVTAERQAVDAVRIMFGVVGLIAVIIGVLVLINPLRALDVFTTVLAVMLAIYMVGAGVIYLGTAVFSKSMGGWARTGNILLGLLYIIAAVILFANLGLAASVLLVFLAVLIGIMWIIEGVIAFTTVKSSGHPVLTVIYGIISVIAGGVLIFSSALGLAVIALMVGISLIVLGVVQVVRAFTIKTVLN